METPAVLSEIQLQTILEKYRDRLLAELPGQIEQLVLFGSYARGEAHPESDVDVLVVVNWPQKRRPDGFYSTDYTDPRWQTIVDLATDMMLEYGIIISPKVYSVERLKENTPFISQVQKDGVELWRQIQTQSTPG